MTVHILRRPCNKLSLEGDRITHFRPVNVGRLNFILKIFEPFPWKSARIRGSATGGMMPLR